MFPPISNATRQYFSRSANRYHEHAKFQQQIAVSLAERTFASLQPTSILELGCGTGFLTKLLAEQFPAAPIDALDLSPAMIRLAQQTIPAANIQWREEDMNQLPVDRQFDLVASSTTLHWGDPFDALIQRISQILRPGGKLIAAVMTAGTLDELHSIREEVVPRKIPLQQLPSAYQLEAALSNAQLIIDNLKTETYSQQFASARELLRQLSLTGFTGGPFSRADSQPLVRSELKKITSCYQQQYGNPQGEVQATFNVTYLSAEASDS